MPDLKKTQWMNKWTGKKEKLNYVKSQIKKYKGSKVKYKMKKERKKMENLM